MKKRPFSSNMLNEVKSWTSQLSTLAVVVMATLTMLSSCIKDEELNKECDVVDAWVDDTYAEHFYNPADMKEKAISSTQTIIEFEVRSLLSLPKELVVHFNITPGATMQPENGSKQDFSNGPVTYTVTSQDGEWKRTYTVKFIESQLPSNKFSFEHVRLVKDINMFKMTNYFHEFVEINGTDTINNWASGNAGAVIIKQNTKAEDQPTYQVAEGYQGKCVCMNTQSAGDMGALFKKPIAAGNLFLGKFIVDSVMTKPLKATRFGVSIKREPIRIKGYYKYQPGKDFTNAEMKVLQGRVDEADIYAVLYSNKKAGSSSVSNNENERYYLYGDQVSDEALKNNPQVFKTARVKSLPATNQWTPFEMFFEGKELDATQLANGGYNLALVFSSSKNGATFEGAIGSTLYIDEVELIYEK